MKTIKVLLVTLLVLGIFVNWADSRQKRSKKRYLHVSLKYHIVNPQAKTCQGKKVNSYQSRIGASNNIALGSQIVIPGFGTFVCADRMNRSFRRLKEPFFEPYFFHHEERKIKRFEKKYNNKKVKVKIRPPKK